MGYVNSLEGNLLYNPYTYCVNMQFYIYIYTYLYLDIYIWIHFGCHPPFSQAKQAETAWFTGLPLRRSCNLPTRNSPNHQPSKQMKTIWGRYTPEIEHGSPEIKSLHKESPFKETMIFRWTTLNFGGKYTLSIRFRCKNGWFDRWSLSFWGNWGAYFQGRKC